MPVYADTSGCRVAIATQQPDGAYNVKMSTFIEGYELKLVLE